MFDGLKNMHGQVPAKEEDVVFTEVNVDSLNKSETKLKITKNGHPQRPGGGRGLHRSGNGRQRTVEPV